MREKEPGKGGMRARSEQPVTGMGGFRIYADPPASRRVLSLAFRD